MVCAHHIFIPFNLVNYTCVKSSPSSLDSYACWNKLTLCMKKILCFFSLYWLDCVLKKCVIDSMQDRAYSFLKFVIYVRNLNYLFSCCYESVCITIIYFENSNMMLSSKANYSLTLFTKKKKKEKIILLHSQTFHD